MCSSCRGVGGYPKTGACRNCIGYFSQKHAQRERWVASVTARKGKGGLDGSRTELFFCVFGEGKYCIGMILFCSVRTDKQGVVCVVLSKSFLTESRQPT